PEPAEQAVEHGLAVLLVDGFGEGDGHRARLDAVLRVAAVGDAVVAHDGRESLVARHLAGGVHVHQAHLGDGLRADVVAVAVLRAGLEAAAAGHAARVGVALGHIVLRHAGAGAEVVRAVDLDPRLDALQVVEHLRAVNDEVADVREFRHRLQSYRLVRFEVVDERRAGLARAPVDDHRADAADLFETVHLPDGRRGGPALARDRVLPDLHQAGDDVEVRAVGDRELLPVRVGVTPLAAANAQDDPLRRVLQPVVLTVRS